MPTRYGLLTAAALSVCALPLIAGHALAQEGYYDQFGNFIPFDAPPPGYYVEPPPQVYYEPPPLLRQAPPVYADPPPQVYYEPPVYDDRPVYAEPPPGWGRRVLVAPPENIPDQRYAYPAPDRRVIEPRVPDDYFIEADPDAERLSTEEPRRDYGEAPVERRGLPPADDSGGLDQPDRPSLDPPAQDRRLAIGDPGRALAALPRYAAAKQEAIGIADPFKRVETVRKVNAWLVAASAQPATAGTISALDRLLGLEVTAQTTALPGAGIEIERPSAGESDKGRSVAARLSDYAARKGSILRAGAGEAGGIAADAERRLEDGGIDLAPEEIAGLDAFLGLGDASAIVAQRAGNDDEETRLR